MLTTLGVDVSGAIPNANGGYAMYRGRRHTLPVGFTSLLTTGVLSLPGKIELARMQLRLLSVDSNAVGNETLASWLRGNVHHEGVRQLLGMLVRVTTFTNDPDHRSAGAAIEQLQLSLRGSVLYVDGGWQTIVDGVRRSAVDAGVRIVPGAHAAALERSSSRIVDAVRLADGSSIRAASAIITGAPADVDALTGVT
jgi:phytoene dehydrogenase-like protein